MKWKEGMAATSPKNSIFRSKTVQKYLQSREKSVLPHIIAPPFFTCAWIIITLLMMAAMAIWFVQVPLYINGSGIIPTTDTKTNNNEATAIILLPVSEASQVREGFPVQIRIGQMTTPIASRIDHIDQKPLSPDMIRKKYSVMIADPSIAITVGLGPDIAKDLYTGSTVQAEIQIGSQSVLALIPFLNMLIPFLKNFKQLWKINL